jgi:hypothetical protein
VYLVEGASLGALGDEKEVDLEWLTAFSRRGAGHRSFLL